MGKKQTTTVQKTGIVHSISLKPSLDSNTQELVRELAEDIAQFGGVPGISEQPLTHLSELGFHHITVWQNHAIEVRTYRGTLDDAEISW